MMIKPRGKTPIVALCLRKACSSQFAIEPRPHIRDLKRQRCRACNARRLEFRWIEGRRRRRVRRFQVLASGVTELPDVRTI
jgi:hypothetical protein